MELFSINYPEDDKIVPKYFKILPHLKNSTMSLWPNIANNRKLPIIQEMIDSILKNSNATHIVFSNTDIGVQKNFYKFIFNKIKNEHFHSLVINRRDNIPKFKNGKRLTEDDLDIIYSEKGGKHPGKDCFVIERKILQKINMRLMFTGFPPWGHTLFVLMKHFCERDNKKIEILRNEHLTFHIGSDAAWFNKKNPSKLHITNEKISKQIRKCINQ